MGHQCATLDIKADILTLRQTISVASLEKRVLSAQSSRPANG